MFLTKLRDYASCFAMFTIHAGIDASCEVIASDRLKDVASGTD